MSIVDLGYIAHNRKAPNTLCTLVKREKKKVSLWHFYATVENFNENFKKQPLKFFFKNLRNFSIG